MDGSLFLLIPTLRTALMRLRRLCFEVANWGLFSFDRTHTYRLDEFVALQNVRRVQVTTWLTEFSSDVRALVGTACNDMLDTFLSENSIRADHKMTHMERAALRNECRKLTKFIRLCDFLVRDTLMGMALDSVSSLLQYMSPLPALAPPHVVRTDFPSDTLSATGAPVTNNVSVEVVSSTAGAATASRGGKKAPVTSAPTFIVLASFVSEQELEADEARGGGLSDDIAVTTAGLEEGDEDDEHAEQHVTRAAIRLTPSQPQVKQVFKSMLYDAMVVISAPPRLLTHEDLASYPQAASEEGDDDDDGGGEDEEVDLTEAVTNHAAYRRMIGDMNAGLDSAFESVASFCEVYLPYAQTYYANESHMDDLSVNFTSDTDLATFERSINDYKTQMARFDGIPTFADIGIVRIDSVELKRRIIPSPTRCLQAIRQLLPELMKALTEALMNEVRSMYNVLASNPADVDPFVSKVCAHLYTARANAHC